MNALRREFGTHLHAADSGWEFPARYGEAMTLLLAQGYITVHRDPKAARTELPTPWGAGQPKFTPEEVAAAEQILEARVVVG